MSDVTSVSSSQPALQATSQLASAAGWQSWLGKAAFESAMIVLSVLLALTLDGWRENRARQTQLAEARAALIGEVRFNRQLVASNDFLPHHLRLHEVYEGMETAGVTDRIDELFKTGVHVPPLRDASWRSFGVSDIASELPFSQRALLAGVYIEQDNVAQLFRNLLTNISHPTSERENPAFRRDLVRTIDLTLTDIVYAEQRLLKSYDEVLKQLSVDGAAAAPR
jgi:hypothetical protein